MEVISNIDYKITYSNRKSIGIYVHRDSSIEVRAPKRTTLKVIRDLVDKKKKWIEESKGKMIKNPITEFSEEEIESLINKGKTILLDKVNYYSKIMKVNPRSIKIGKAKSYWGCCTDKNNIIFSYRLFCLEEEMINYVIVHELAHIKEHNHGKVFWEKVERVIPDYKRIREELSQLN